ncbi:MAG: flagellar hook-length control protein FliK [Gammaproteobacteria bacterium]
MNIQSTLLSRLQPSRSTPPVDLKNWLVGKLLNASVVERRPGNTLLLKVQDQLIEARSQQPVALKPGEKLTLKVMDNGNPAILKVVQQNPPSSFQLQQQLLRETLPRQAGLEKMNAVLKQVQVKAQGVVAALPAPVKKQLQKLIDTLPTPKSLNTGQGVKSALTDSGLFLEAKLLSQAKPQPPAATLARAPIQQVPVLPGTDLKANLLQLARVIKQAQPATQVATTSASVSPQVAHALVSEVAGVTKKYSTTGAAAVTTTQTAAHNRQSAPVPLVIKQVDVEQLGKQVEAALARIETNQARAIVTDGQPLTGWSFEIPVKDQDELDLVKLDLEQRKNNDENEETQGNWTVNLRIEFESGGNLSARVSMFVSEMNVALWSHENNIDELIATNLNRLDERLHNKGLQLKQVQHIQLLEEKSGPQQETNLINIML